ncbi:MAG: DUF3108 domain-containing protein [Elusimicrobia bacterium]|nr:DUF3108 domain-containing protein [Elusimicrobiota bacterium]
MVFKLLLLLALPAAAAEPTALRHPFWGLTPSTGAIAAPFPGLVRGETLEYDIYWGAIQVGKSFLRIYESVEISSRPAWHIVSEARSGSFIANFYKVDDRNEAWMDAETLTSYGYYKKISEGSHFFNEWVVFDQKAGRYYGEKVNKKKQLSSFEGLLDRPVNDVLSAVYRLRAMTIEPGKTLEMDVNTKKNWRLNIKAGKREKIKTEFGKKQCILFEPKMGEDGLFVAKAGKRMLVWITDDELKLPMVLKAEIFIGSITAKLSRRYLEER